MPPLKLTEIQVGKDDEPIRIPAFHHFDGSFELIACAAAQIDHHAHVDRIHFLHKLVHFFGLWVAVVTVNIHKWKFGAFHFVFFGDERGFRLVFLNGQGLLLTKDLSSN